MPVRCPFSLRRDDITMNAESVVSCFLTEEIMKDILLPRNEGEVEKIILQTLSEQAYRDWLRAHAAPYFELMAYYRCAMMEVETKFRVLSEERTLRYDYNPVEAVKTRLKRPESIVRKMDRYGVPLTADNIEATLNDVAGVRVICSFISDIYSLADALLKQDDVTLIRRKDYIQHPKENGYRSLHLIIEIPVFLHDQKRMMKVEVQLRTTAMDWWASAEHKIRYKKDLSDELLAEIDRELLDGARISAELDEKMALIHAKVTTKGRGDL